MELNFIEEVAKALDVFSVERLVRSSPLSAVKCKKCKKILYTRVQARFVILRILMEENAYMGAYECPEQEGQLYHVTNLDKRLSKETYWMYRREIEQKKQDLDELRKICRDNQSNGHRDNTVLRVQQRNLVVVDGRSIVPYPKALRLQIQRALIHPVQGLRKPRPHPYRRRRKSRPRYRVETSDQARKALPRGELMTKMMSWANADKFHTDREHRRCCRPKVDGDKFRRRCRAREDEAVRKLIESEKGDRHA